MDIQDEASAVFNVVCLFELQVDSNCNFVNYISISSGIIISSSIIIIIIFNTL